MYHSSRLRGDDSFFHYLYPWPYSLGPDLLALFLILNLSRFVLISQGLLNIMGHLLIVAEL